MEAEDPGVAESPERGDGNVEPGEEEEEGLEPGEDEEETKERGRISSSQDFGFEIRDMWVVEGLGMSEGE